MMKAKEKAQDNDVIKNKALQCLSIAVDVLLNTILENQSLTGTKLKKK